MYVRKHTLVGLDWSDRGSAKIYTVFIKSVRTVFELTFILYHWHASSWCHVQRKLNFWLNPFVKQSQKQCSGPQPVYQDLSMHPRGEGGNSTYERGGDAHRKFWIKPLDWPIVNRVDWLWNLSDSSLVDMFLWTWKCTTLKSIPIILIVLTNKNVALIYSITICQKKTKDCAPSGSLQHRLQQALLFL